MVYLFRELLYLTELLAPPMRFALVLLSLLVSLSLGEVLLRFAFPSVLHKQTERFLSWSSPHFTSDQNGAVRYIPNETVREVAVYDGQVEYDTTYSTNNFGFIDSDDYGISTADMAKSQRIALIGDSFTAGSGGYSWPSELRKSLQDQGYDVFVYNFGIAGAGTQHFLQVLDSVAESLTFDLIVLMVLTEDLYRYPWEPYTTSEQIFFCYDKEKTDTCHPIATVIPLNASAEEIISRQSEFVTPSSESDVVQESLFHRIKATLNYSHLFRLVNKLRRESFQKPNHEEFPTAGFQSITQIRERFSGTPLLFFHLPEKREVIRGAYRLELREKVEGEGLTYVSGLDQCGFLQEMFYVNDAHPNTDGYRRISDCLEEYLKTNNLIRINGARSE